MKGKDLCDLKSCFLCSNSVSAWLASIKAHKTNLDIKKGEAVFEEGQKAKGIFFLYSGRVKVHKRWDHQKELILKFAKKGDILGFRGLGNEKIYPVTAIALEPVTVCFIDLTFFEDMLKANHLLTFQLMKFYANELQEAETRIRDLAHMDVKGRLADTLIQLKKQFGHNKDGIINIKLTRQDIASYAGTTYETVFRIMQDLTKRKIIKVTGKNIIILNELKLKELALPEKQK